MSSQEVCERHWKLMGASRRDGKRALTTEDEDSTLVARFSKGEMAAFDSLFARHQDYVYHIVYGIVGNAEESRDLTQEVFLQVYRSLPKFRGGARFATWLYRIAVNRAVDAARGSRRWRFLALWEEPGLLNRAADPTQEPEAMFERQLERAEVQEILMRCPLAHRQVLALRYYRDMTVEEIAETMGCSLSAAKVRLHRARAAFKTCYLAFHEASSGTTTQPAQILAQIPTQRTVCESDTQIQKQPMYGAEPEETGDKLDEADRLDQHERKRKNAPRSIH